MARRNRSPEQEFILFRATSSLGWAISKRISYDKGERLVDQRVARRVDDEYGKHIGYQPCEPSEAKDDAPVVRSSPAISQGEILANAGTAFRLGGSRTAKMSEAMRISRTHPRSGKLLPAEDRIERAVAKVKAWPHPASVAGDKAVRVYPKDPDRERSL